MDNQEEVGNNSDMDRTIHEQSKHEGCEEFCDVVTSDCIRPKRKFKCVICFVEWQGFGNNALPVVDGRCCDECYETVVIRARINQIYQIQ